MKNTVLLITSMIMAISCSSKHVKTDKVRTMEDIFHEVIDAATGSKRDQSSVRRSVGLFDELADTLCSVMLNSDLADANSRLVAQQIASYALFLAEDYRQETGADLGLCVSKYGKAMSIWRSLETDSGTTYVKEICYNIRQDTEDEDGRCMFVTASLTEDVQCKILLPKEARSAYVIFTKKSEEGYGYDTENAAFIDGGEGFMNDVEYMTFRFDPQEFMAALATYDAMFIYYLEADGTRESAMTGLEELHGMMGD